MLQRLLRINKLTQSTVVTFTRSCSSSSSSTSNANNNDKTKNVATPSGQATTIEPEHVAGEEELQNHWKSMESRVINRKLRRKEDAKVVGRGKRLPSAWDHENV